MNKKYFLWWQYSRVLGFVYPYTCKVVCFVRINITPIHVDMEELFNLNRNKNKNIDSLLLAYFQSLPNSCIKKNDYHTIHIRYRSVWNTDVGIC